MGQGRRGLRVRVALQTVRILTIHRDYLLDHRKYEEGPKNNPKQQSNKKQKKKQTNPFITEDAHDKSHRLIRVPKLAQRILWKRIDKLTGYILKLR